MDQIGILIYANPISLGSFLQTQVLGVSTYSSHAPPKSPVQGLSTLGSLQTTSSNNALVPN